METTQVCKLVLASLWLTAVATDGANNNNPLLFPDQHPNIRQNQNNNNAASKLVFPREDNVPCVTYEGTRGSCRLLVQCATFYAEIAQLSRSPCTISSQQQGVCCPPTKLPTQDATNVVSRPHKPIVFGPNMETKEINNACEEGIWKLKRRMAHENELIDRNVVASEGTPVFFHARLFETSDDIVKKAQDATLTLQATQELVNRFSLTKEQAEHALPEFGVQNTIIAETCPPQPICPSTKYRSVNGSCNNLENKDWGATGTAYERVLPADYSDGVSSPRLSTSGGPLPSPRSISSFVTADKSHTYTNFTLLIMQWGQFLDHDITHTPISKGPNKADISCCIRGTIREARDLHPECMPIRISPDDPFYSSFNQGCMEFVRSMPAIRPKCKFGPREQMNQITAFIDASNVYGSTAADAAKLRSFRGGLLKTTPQGASHLLPGDRNSPGCRPQSSQRPCFMAGDSRVNEQPDLAVLHTIWMRQHNRVANELADLNPGWRHNDEILYQEARRIIIAQMQHITYNEYLPIVLGRNFMETYGLVPLKTGYATTYKKIVNPSIINGFTAAAFRYGHTLISDSLEGYGKFGGKNKDLVLSESQFHPFSLYEPGTFDSLVRGLVRQQSQKFDHFFTNEITNKLFAQNTPFGMDLVALNIQRGRDHGLPSYNRWREICQLKTATIWNDLMDVMDQTVVAKLAQLYSSVDDVDLFIGGISERPVPGSLLGPTFLCLVGDQFARLKLGDRFYYENGNLDSSFNAAQLTEIRKTSLARILCDNSNDLTMMQPLAFITPHFANKRALCKSDILIPKPDFSKWINEPVWN